MRIRTCNAGRNARTITRAERRLSDIMQRAAYCNISSDGPSLSVSLTGSDGVSYTVEISYEDLDLLIASRDYYKSRQ